MDINLTISNLTFMNIQNCSVLFDVAYEDDIDTPSSNFILELDNIQILNSSITSNLISFDINSKISSPGLNVKNLSILNS